MDALLKSVQSRPTYNQVCAVMTQYIEDFIQYPDKFDKNSVNIIKTLHIRNPANPSELYDGINSFRTQAPMFVNIMVIIMEQYGYTIPHKYGPYLPMLLGSATRCLNLDIFDIDLAMRDIIHIIQDPHKFNYFKAVIDYIKSSQDEINLEIIYEEFMRAISCKAISKHEHIIAHELYYNIIRRRFLHIIEDIKKVVNDDNLAQLIVSIHESDDAHR